MGVFLNAKYANVSKYKHQTMQIYVMAVPEVPLPPPSSNSNPLKFWENA